MNYLLDTHALIWFLHNDKLLSLKALETIETCNMFISIASLWEISIKISLGKLTLSHSFEELFPQQLEINDIRILPVAIKHLKVLNKLSYHHRDPFDRLIIAQSIAENMTVISRDNSFKAYDIELLW